MKHFSVALVMLLFALSISCTSHSDEVAVNTTTPYDLGWFQKRKLEKAALTGDADAAFKTRLRGTRIENMSPGMDEDGAGYRVQADGS